MLQEEGKFQDTSCSFIQAGQVSSRKLEKVQEFDVRNKISPKYPLA